MKGGIRGMSGRGDAAPAQGRSLPRVLGWMSGALVFFSAMAISIRELAPVLGVFEMLSLRCLGGLAMLLGWAALGMGRIGPPRPLSLHLARNLIHLGGQSAWTLGLTLLPLATVFALEFTAPAWVTLLAVIFLGERATPGRIGGLVLGFLGVLVVLRPGAETFRPEALVVLGAALCFATALVFTKAMTARMNTLTLLVWMQVIQLPLILLGHLLAHGGGLPFARLAEASAPMVALLCVSGLAAQVSVAQAFRHGDAATVVPLDFLRIPLIAAIGAVLYAEPFDGLVLAGAAVTAAGIVCTLRGAAPAGAKQASPAATAGMPAPVAGRAAAGPGAAAVERTPAQGGAMDDAGEAVGPGGAAGGQGPAGPGAPPGAACPAPGAQPRPRM